ncbi:histidine phosphatase family protein [Streptococcus dysgalactiae]|uniref:histidine phosphatase family protein n=1 Tax=Streptococcus dysgalactiae TaxID=1334 RepID=UPI001FAAC52E|nr:histidine phosphatase family protein [Streptococcus dysgalactiae]MEE3742837.1 histidine phosphatase family protein [Streptococcus dysgalactiae]
MKLYFVRHGKTLWNLEGRFQGAGGDSPLLEESKDEIRLLGKSLSKISFDAVYTSDLPRAMATAAIILDSFDQEPILYHTNQLREWRLGKLEEAKIATMTAIYPQQMSAFRHNLAQFKSHQFEAESIYKTTHRVRQLIQSFGCKNYHNVLIVGHGANLTASIRSLLGFEPALLLAKGGLDNASLTILETKNGQDFQCLKWNDKSFTE